VKRRASHVIDESNVIFLIVYARGEHVPPKFRLGGPLMPLPYKWGEIFKVGLLFSVNLFCQFVFRPAVRPGIMIKSRIIVCRFGLGQAYFIIHFEPKSHKA